MEETLILRAASWEGEALGTPRRLVSRRPDRLLCRKQGGELAALSRQREPVLGALPTPRLCSVSMRQAL